MENPFWMVNLGIQYQPTGECSPFSRRRIRRDTRCLHNLANFCARWPLRQGCAPLLDVFQLEVVMNRRRFLQVSGAGIAMVALRRRAYGFYQTRGTPLWKTAFRGVGPKGIPVAAPDSSPAAVTGVTHYSINIGQYADQIHPTLGPTTLWGYQPANPLGGGTQDQKHLGGILVAQKVFRFNLRLPTSCHPLTSFR
jgi:hypothetical protein